MKNKYVKPVLKKRVIKLNLFSRISVTENSLIYDTLLSVYCYCVCVTQNTLITLFDKTTQPIINIQPGQYVLSYHVQEKKFVKNKVIKLIVHENENTDGYYIINSSLNITGNHRVWTNNRGWIRVDEIKMGDELLSKDEKTEIVTSIQKKKGAETVYNLDLEKPPHNFFAEGMLIHNATKN